jgi:hypothetical protein
VWTCRQILIYRVLLQWLNQRGLVGSVAMHERKIIWNLTGKLDGEELFKRILQRHVCEGMQLIVLAQFIVIFWGFVVMVMNIWIPLQ